MGVLGLIIMSGALVHLGALCRGSEIRVVISSEVRSLLALLVLSWELGAEHTWLSSW